MWPLTCRADFVKNPVWVTLMGPNGGPRVGFATKNVKTVLRDAAGGYLFTIPSHNFSSFLFIMIESEVVYLGKMPITRPNYTLLINDISCSLSSILMIKTVAQNANTTKPVLVKLECRDVSISLRKLHKSFATLNG